MAVVATVLPSGSNVSIVCSSRSRQILVSYYSAAIRRSLAQWCDEPLTSDGLSRQYAMVSLYQKVVLISWLAVEPKTIKNQAGIQ